MVGTLGELETLCETLAGLQRDVATWTLTKPIAGTPRERWAAYQRIARRAKKGERARALCDFDGRLYRQALSCV